MCVCVGKHTRICVSIFSWEMLMVRSMHTVMNYVVMKVGGTESIPKTGRPKPFITALDILCSGRKCVIFLDHNSNGFFE